MFRPVPQLPKSPGGDAKALMDAGHAVNLGHAQRHLSLRNSEFSKWAINTYALYPGGAHYLYYPRQ